MDRLCYNGKIFELYEYPSEEEFEKAIIEHSREIFGPKSVYLDIKKKIGEDKILSIPDGYLIDFSFENNPQLYIIENELEYHDPYKHIGEQLLKFAISYKASGRKIKSFLLKSILNDETKKEIVETGLIKANYRNIDAFLESLIFDKPVSCIVVIDQINEDLINVLNQLTMKTDILEFQTYICGGEHIHKFTPFQQELLPITEANETDIKVEDLDTIVVPAKEQGFNEVFLGQNCWYAIRISSSMLDRIKYIAGYQSAPVSAITYYAEVDRIEKHKPTGKYIVYFKGPAKKIGPIKLTDKKRAIFSPRYTTFEKLLKAKKIEEVF
ncbi:MAG: hypothetical protein ACM3YE_04090 [Bacteroidota bacterium]